MATKRRIAVDLPEALGERFRRSKFRTEAQTDAEGVRAALRFALETEPVVRVVPARKGRTKRAS